MGLLMDFKTHSSNTYSPLFHPCPEEHTVHFFRIPQVVYLCGKKWGKILPKILFIFLKRIDHINFLLEPFVKYFSPSKSGCTATKEAAQSKILSTLKKLLFQKNPFGNEIRSFIYGCWLAKVLQKRATS